MSTLSTDQLLHAYRVMRTIRAFEERLHVEFATGEIPGFVHLYAGEEASAAGVMAHLRDDDCIASTHRGHGHCIAKGVDVHGMMAEIYGKKTGVCQGKGGSMHIADLEKGMLGANGIVGAGAPLAAGAALAAKLKGSDAVAVAFFGDGGSNEGAVFEAMNLAAVWNLPCLFVAENNGYAEATAANWSVACDHIADRAAGFGMPGVTVDGFDFFAVHVIRRRPLAQERLVRIAPARHQLGHRDAIRRQRALRQQAETPRHFPSRQAVDIPTVQHHPALGRRQQARQCRQQGRLAAGVGPDDHTERTLGDGQREIPRNGPRVATQGHGVRVQAMGHGRFLDENGSNMWNRFYIME
ncbi:acetoin:2,6-dichlorophenolindophenol oxidoreductase subunit alpha [Pseudomonas aeruginosa VRFPA09]|nr:acetoin:2,6-dichlorophenolindophenol oxidoreductase subunit alpha [Pseudomonas aeruginosa VRFPA09]